MNYLHETIDLEAGDVVEVGLDSSANVLLMDPPNYRAYQLGRPYRYHGGFVEESPLKIKAPHPGPWHVVIDLGGYPGAVRASIGVLKAAMAS